MYLFLFSFLTAIIWHQISANNLSEDTSAIFKTYLRRTLYWVYLYSRAAVGEEWEKCEHQSERRSRSGRRCSRHRSKFPCSPPCQSSWMTPNSEKRLTHQEIVLPSRGTLAGWRNGWQEPHEVHQMEALGSIPGEEQPHAPLYAGCWLAGKEFDRKGSEGIVGYQVEHKPVMCPHVKEG